MDIKNIVVEFNDGSVKTFKVTETTEVVPVVETTPEVVVEPVVETPEVVAPVDEVKE